MALLRNPQLRRWLPVTVAMLLAVVAGSRMIILAHAADNTKEPVRLASLAPVIPPASGEQCVADTDLMRSDHMALLNHQRDETVLEGKRDNPFSLVACVNCHAQTAADGSPIRIDAKGQFCESCHSYAAVKIDCFTCHAAVPEQAKVIGLRDSAVPLLAEIQLQSMLPANLHSTSGLSETGKYHGNKHALVIAD